MVEYEAALKLDPFFADCHYNLGASSRNDNYSGSGAWGLGAWASRGKQGDAKSSEGTRADSLSHAIALASVRSRVLSSALRRCRDVDPPAPMPMLDPSHVVTTSAEPAYCPSCELKHMRRPDWLCPRCGMPVESDAPRIPKGKARPAPRSEPVFPPGSRIAGAIVAVNGGALAIGFAKYPASEHRWTLLAAALILAVLGLELLLKVSLARWAAVVSAVVAAALVSEDLIRDRLPDLFRDPLPAVIRDWLRDLIRDPLPVKIPFFMGFLAGCVLLLVGRPRGVRIAAGVLLAAPLVVVEIMRAFAR